MRTEQVTAKALEYMDNDRYKLSILVAKRAEQLSNGASPLIKVSKEITKFTDIALREVAEGKVGIDSITDKE